MECTSCTTRSVRRRCSPCSSHRVNRRWRWWPTLCSTCLCSRWSTFTRRSRTTRWRCEARASKPVTSSSNSDWSPWLPPLKASWLRSFSLYFTLPISVDISRRLNSRNMLMGRALSLVTVRVFMRSKYANERDEVPDHLLPFQLPSTLTLLNREIPRIRTHAFICMLDRWETLWSPT